jgi:uncharacterized protein (DUF2461 family)
VADTFTGFPPTGIAFLAGLAADNARTYFNANRDTYANDVAAPLRALVVAVGERLRAEAVPDVCFEPSVGKSLFRINCPPWTATPPPPSCASESGRASISPSSP